MAIRSNRPPPPKTPVTPTRDAQRNPTTSKTQAATAVTPSKAGFAQDAVEGTDSHRAASAEEGEGLSAAAKKATDGNGKLRRAGRNRTPAPVRDAGKRGTSTADTIAEENANESLLGFDPDEAPTIKKAATAKGAAAGTAAAKGSAPGKGAARAAAGGAAAGGGGGGGKAGAAAATGAAKGAAPATAKTAEAGAKPGAAKAGDAVAAGDGGNKQGGKAAAAGGDADGDEAIMAKAREAAAKGPAGGKGPSGAQTAAQAQKAASGGAKKGAGTPQKGAAAASAKSGGAKGAKGAKSSGPAVKGGGGAPIGDVKHMREVEGQLVSDREAGGGGREVTADLAPAVAEAVAQVEAEGGTVRVGDKPAVEEGGAKVDTPTALRGGERAAGDAFSVGARDVPKADLAEVARDTPDSGELDKELRSALSAQRESDVQDHLQANTGASQLGSRKVSEAEPFDGIGSEVRDEGDHVDGLLMTKEERAKAAKKGLPFVQSGDRRGIDAPVITADMAAMASALAGKGVDISDITSGLEAELDTDGEGDGEEEVEEEEEEG